MVSKAVERAELNRRRFLQLSVASLAAGGLDVALDRPALAQEPDPVSEESDLIVIDGLTEAAKDPEVQQYVRTGALPFWVAGLFVNVWRANLEFISVPRDLADYYRRAGAAYRDRAGAQAIWETIPRQIRMGGPEALRRFHSSRDWSHFIPRILGGGDSASEGIFEDSVLNRSRGAKPMTATEIEAARMALRTQAVKDAIRQTARVTVAGALVGPVTAGVFAVMEHGLSYQEGEIDQSELFDLVWKELGVGTAVGIGITGIIAGLVMIFPALTAVISPFVLPLAFVGFAFLGYQFYTAAKSWKDAGFDPLLGAWDTSKEISKQVWARSATLFENFQDAAGSALQRAIDWFRGRSSPVEVCYYSLVEIDDYSVAEIYDYSPGEVCD
ncbi:MAG: hypothetical protein OXG79_13935 [Chloroflexi bacterium]|nr:hypothetical protein [Chloroflexota bacterium]